MRFLTAALAAFFFFSAAAFAADVQRAAAPAWVEDMALPGIDTGMLHYADGGLYTILLDDQVRWEGETRLYYSRIVTKVLSRAGLEDAASLTRSFDPATETLTLTHLDIIRDGRRIELRDKVAFDVFRRESDLESGMIDGTLTAHAQLPDLRVGDIVDLAFLWSSSPLFPGQTFSVWFDPEYSDPVGLNRVVAYWPADRPLQTSAIPPSVERTDKIDGDIHRIERVTRAHKPITVEDDLPPEVDPWGTVLLSGSKDWAEVAGSIAEHYRTLSVLPAAWKDVPDEIRAAGTAEGDRAYAALHYVQDHIRYVGVEVGGGSYFARTPATVVEGGFGDCKDKAVLLVALLRALGIEADVALALLDGGMAIKDGPPSSRVFDHMVVRTVIDGKPVWMDPTLSYQAGMVGSAAPPAYGYALPLTGKAAGQLLLMPEDPAAIDREFVVQTFQFTDGGAQMDVDTLASGRAADRLRADWAEDAPGDIEERYLSYYEGYYPGIASRSPVKTVDDTALNRFSIHEQYDIPAEALAEKELFTDFVLFLPDFSRLLPEVGRGPRTHPLYLGEPRERIHRIVVKDAPINFNAPPEVSVRDEAFDFHYSGDAKGEGGLTLNWLLTVPARTVDPARIGAYRRARATADDASYWAWDLTPERAPDAGEDATTGN